MKLPISIVCVRKLSKKNYNVSTILRDIDISMFFTNSHQPAFSNSMIRTINSCTPNFESCNSVQEVTALKKYANALCKNIVLKRLVEIYICIHSKHI